AAALFVWSSGDDGDRPAAIGERKSEGRLDGAQAGNSADTREIQSGGGADAAEPRRPPASRTVTEQQASTAADILKGFPRSQRPLAEPIAVLALAGDAEAADYAKQLAQVLEESGWATTIGTTAVRYLGVMCLVDNAGQFPIHARVLTFAFERAG